MLRRIRVIVAWLVFAAALLLVLDFSGLSHAWLGWVARVQLVPAVLAGSAIAIGVVVVMTLLFGRLYCSVLCPLGIMQDGFTWLGDRRRGRGRGGRARFRWLEPMNWLRYGLPAVFVVALAAGVAWVASLLDPWGVFGRIAENIFAPLWRLGNNALAWGAERIDSYAFYTVDVWVKSWIVFAAAVIWLVGLAVLAWRRGRWYCNSLCPVGTVLGLVSRVSVFRPAIDPATCTKCGLCEKKCKGGCIDSKAGVIDRSRCVVCFDCMEACNFGALEYRAGRRNEKAQSEAPGSVKTGVSRRKFFAIAGAVAAAPAVGRAQNVERILMQVDGGLAEIVPKQRPERATPVTPPGSEGAKHLRAHCTACQLCVAACPHGVLTPSSKLATLMQPEMTFERGYCRPECVECGRVCPTSAIGRITPADKTAIAVGQAHVNRELCVVTRDNVPCTECERHCPTKAITLVDRLPVVDTTLCIGCGACENLCPARPLSAIHIEGNVTHHEL